MCSQKATTTVNWHLCVQARRGQMQQQFEIRCLSNYKTQLIPTPGVQAVIPNDCLCSKLSYGTKYTLVF